MTADQLSEAGVQLNKGALVAGAILVGVGGLLGATGLLLGSYTFVSAARQWVRQLERPPSETAKLKWEQVRSAGSAAAEAWQKNA